MRARAALESGRFPGSLEDICNLQQVQRLAKQVWKEEFQESTHSTVNEMFQQYHQDRSRFAERTLKRPLNHKNSKFAAASQPKLQYTTPRRTRDSSYIPNALLQRALNHTGSEEIVRKRWKARVCVFCGGQHYARSCTMEQHSNIANKTSNTNNAIITDFPKASGQ